MLIPGLPPEMQIQWGLSQAPFPAVTLQMVPSPPPPEEHRPVTLAFGGNNLMYNENSTFLSKGERG